MPQGAYCSGCARRVQLTESGECPQGHLRSMLRDVREGVEPVGMTTVRPVVLPAATDPAAHRHELLSMVIGKAFVIVPVAAIAVFGLWTGYEMGVDSGMTVASALLMSVVSLVVTIGAAFAWAAMRRKKH